jgi:hypothetical protein
LSIAVVRKCPFFDILRPTNVSTGSAGLPMELDFTGAGKATTFTVYTSYESSSPRASLPDVPIPHWNEEVSYAIAGLTNPEIISDAITNLINNSVLAYDIISYPLLFYPILY